MPLLSWKEFTEQIPRQVRKPKLSEEKILEIFSTIGNQPEKHEEIVEDVTVSMQSVNSLIEQINHAQLEELTTIKGIGVKTAEKILSQAPYTDFDDLFFKNKLRITVGEELEKWAKQRICGGIDQTNQES